MPRPKHTRTRGLLRRDAAPSPFLLARYHPRRELRELVEDLWVVRWDLSGQPAYSQQVLAHPCITLAIDADQSGVFGVVTGRFERRLEGVGRAVGVKFWPGAYTSIHAGSVHKLTDRCVPLGEAFGSAGTQLEASVLASDDDGDIQRLLEDFLLARRTSLSPSARTAREVVARIAADPDLSRVEEVAQAVGLGVRALQRLVRDCVGVSPKWLIQRYRLHEALARMEDGEQVDLALLAAELGYADQAHFAREFKRLVGRPPGAYARDVRPGDGAS